MSSSNEKIRKLHAEVTAQMAAWREERRRLREEDERAMDEYAAAFENGETADANSTPYDQPYTVDDLDDDIPF